MAFRATNIISSDAYLVVKRAAVQLKLVSEGFVATLAAESVDYDFVRDVYLTLTRAANQFATLKATPGLAAYAQAQEDDPTYDVAAEFVGMESAIAAAVAWLDANVPTNVTAKAPADWDDGSLISNTFSPAQTAGLRTQLNAIISEIV